ncbi:hypothetical protein JCM3765_002968 [Sporobolomyces pararoseus]
MKVSSASKEMDHDSELESDFEDEESDVDHETEYEEVVKPEMLIGTPTLWWIGIVTSAFLAAAHKVNWTFYSLAFSLRKDIEVGDLIIIRAHDAEMVKEIYADDPTAGETFASKMTVLLFDFCGASTLGILVNTLTDSNIQSLHGFIDLPAEVQERVIKEFEYIKKNNKAVRLPREDRLSVVRVTPNGQQQRGLDALAKVQDYKLREAMWSDPEYNQNACGLIRGPRRLTEETFCSKFEAVNGNQGIWTPGVLQPTDSANAIAIARARIVLKAIDAAESRDEATRMPTCQADGNESDEDEPFNVIAVLR